MPAAFRQLPSIPTRIFPVSNAQTIHELLTLYLSDILPTKAAQTQYQMGLYYRRLDKELGTMPLAEVTPMFLRTWRDKLARVYAPGTVRCYLHALSSLLTAAVKEYEWLDANPMAKVRKPAMAPTRGRFLTPQEQGKLLTACQGSRCACLHTVVLLALTTGARKMELMTLTWERVDLQGGFIHLAQTKNGEPRRVPLRGQARSLMRERAIHQRGKRLCFEGVKPGRPVHMDVHWRAAVKAAGLTGFRFHDLRHSCASYLAMSGASLLEIAEILGHKTMQMVKRYSHFTAGHTGSVVERMAEQFLPEG